MLVRQKTLLALLSRVNKPLSPTVFVKLAFLLRQETDLGKDRAFYDFVPYKYGPFSFSLYRELTNLRRDGYVTPDERRVALCEKTIGLIESEIKGLPPAIHEAVGRIVSRYGKESQSLLVKDVYARYSWYAIKSELKGLQPKSSIHARKANPVIHTIGYEGKSVDAFFNVLLQRGIRLIIDVRANPVSRSYGFSRKRLSEIAKRLGFEYCHMPNLGIPSEYRVDLTDFDSYQRLLGRYEEEILPRLKNEIQEVGKSMRETPAVLMCVEEDVQCCHRSRLAVAVSQVTGLEVKHI